ncbi:MAG: hypothetical protein LBC74_16085 [Planctomycetaceae bacterium]|jgi:hypothetical protein|nr:hypothetical protein [Planctomycetaceae bacterium]
MVKTINTKIIAALPLTPPKEGNNSTPSEASSYSPPSEELGVVSEELKAVFRCRFFVALMYF